MVHLRQDHMKLGIVGKEHWCSYDSPMLAPLSAVPVAHVPTAASTGLV